MIEPLTRPRWGRAFGAAVAVGALLFVVSCGDDNSAGPVLTADQHNEKGWAAYSVDDFIGARTHFHEALDLDPDLVESRLGLAWSAAQLAEYGVSLEEFQKVVESGEYVTDAFAGRAAPALELPDYPLAAASAESALARDPFYFFPRDSDYGHRALRLIIAQSRYALADYSSAQEQVDFIDPDNGLDPADPQSWVVIGLAYPTYQAALAVLIEHLWSLEASRLG